MLQPEDFALGLDSWSDPGAYLDALLADFPLKVPTEACHPQASSSDTIPPRIDRPDDDPDRLLDFIPAFSAKDTREQAVKSLGLSRPNHMQFMGELRDFVLEPRNAERMKNMDSVHYEATKKTWIRFSLGFLQHCRPGEDCRGLLWFGLTSMPYREGHSPIWPDKSSEILCCVTVLMYTASRNSKQKARSAVIRQQKRTAKNPKAHDGSRAEPIAKRRQAHAPGEGPMIICID